MLDRNMLKKRWKLPNFPNFERIYLFQYPAASINEDFHLS